MKFSIRRALPLAAFALSAASSSGQELPSAEAILDRYVAVTGGQAAYDRVQNQVMKFTISMGGRVVSQATSYRTRTGDYRETGNAFGGPADAGVQGGVAWSRFGETAHLLDTGEERAQALRSAVLLPEGQWRTYYTAAETSGTGAINDKPCYVLKVVPFAGGPRKLYFDRQSGLLLRDVGPAPDGNVVEYAFEEYFEAGGIRLPRVISLSAGGATLRTVVDEVKFNEPVPDSMFVPPPEISRLLKKRAPAGK